MELIEQSETRKGCSTAFVMYHNGISVSNEVAAKALKLLHIHW